MIELTKAEKKWIIEAIDEVRDSCFNYDYGGFRTDDWFEKHFEDLPHSEFLLMKSLWHKLKGIK